MRKIWQIGLTALSVAVLSASVTVGTYSLLKQNDREVSPISSTRADGGTFDNASFALTSNRTVGTAPDLIPAAEASVHSVVHIKVEGEQQVDQRYVDPFEFFFGGGGGFERPQSRPVVGYGSGVIISTDGYIITNNHVIDNATKIEVTLNDNRTFKATMVGSDPATDIALIKIEEKGLPTIPFGNSDDLKVGEWVLAVGNPFNLTSTVTAGIVSAKARSAGDATRRDMKIGGFIQTDAAVNPGNSGGALVNAAGELVGINTMIYSQTGNFTGYSFAVPVNSAAKVVADIKKYGAVQRAVLGIVGGNVSSEIKEKYNLKVNEGAFVADFAERSAAFSAGLDKEDVIVAIDGRPIKSMTELQEVINMRRPGDKVLLTIDRKGQKKEFSVTLKNTEGDISVIKQNPKELLGATFKELSNEQKRSYGVSYGIVATKVGNGKLKEADIKEGFIILTLNNTPVRSLNEARRIVAKVKTSSNDKGLVVRGFYPNGRIRYYLIDLS